MTAGWTIAAGLASAGGATLAYGMFHPRSELFGPLTWKGPIDTGAIALSFDDGPDPETTPRLLDILRRFDVRATFFVIGANVERWPDVLRSVHDDGHLIGNHTFDHHYTGAFRRTRYWRSQLERTDEAIRRIIGKKPTLFRPPMGFKHPHLFTAARLSDHRVVTWARRAFDGVATTPQRIVARLADRAAPGDILMLHDGSPPGHRRARDATAEALPSLLDHWRSRNLRVAPLDDLISAELTHRNTSHRH